MNYNWEIDSKEEKMQKMKEINELNTIKEIIKELDNKFDVYYKNEKFVSIHININRNDVCVRYSFIPEKININDINDINLFPKIIKEKLVDNINKNGLLLSNVVECINDETNDY